MSVSNLHSLAKSVQTRADFIKFAERLREDFATNAVEWENTSLEQFLKGLEGFARDMHGYYMNMKEPDIDVEQISWRIAADMLLAATVYGG